MKGINMSDEWTSRKRVEAALTHHEPDRVPIDFSITLNAYVNLREYLGLPVDENIQADHFFEVRPAMDVIETLGIDMTFIRLRGPANWTPPPPLADGTVLDQWGVGRKLIQQSGGSYLNEVCYSPWQDQDPAEIDLDSYPWPDPYASGRTAGLAEEAQQLYEETDLALMGRFGGPILEIASYLRGFEQWLMDLVLYPEFSRKLLDRIADIQIALDEIGIKAAGKYLSVFKVSGEDLGMQTGPLFSPKTWDEVLYPVLNRRWRAARAALDVHAPHVKMMLHSDGAIRPFIPDIINSGIEVLDPIQPVCKGMELDGLKRDFGQQLTFHGSVDTQFLLPFSTAQEVETEVKRCITTLGKGGGLILSSSHFIQPDVPAENIAAMYGAAKQYGEYPLQKKLRKTR